MQKYYGKYYFIGFSGAYNTLVADQAFDMCLYKPHFIKLITSTIDLYLCGGDIKTF